MTTKLMEKPIPVVDKEQAQVTCIHHWLIEPPEGPVSKGECLKCGDKQEFGNYFGHSMWESETEAVDDKIDFSFLGQDNLSPIND